MNFGVATCPKCGWSTEAMEQRHHETLEIADCPKCEGIKEGLSKAQVFITYLAGIKDPAPLLRLFEAICLDVLNEHKKASETGEEVK